MRYAFTLAMVVHNLIRVPGLFTPREARGSRNWPGLAIEAGMISLTHGHDSAATLRPHPGSKPNSPLMGVPVMAMDVSRRGTFIVTQPAVTLSHPLGSPLNSAKRANQPYCHMNARATDAVSASAIATLKARAVRSLRSRR